MSGFKPAWGLSADRQPIALTLPGGEVASQREFTPEVTDGWNWAMTCRSAAPSLTVRTVTTQPDYHILCLAAPRVLATAAFRVIYVLLYNNAGGSLFAIILFHAVANTGEARFPEESCLCAAQRDNRICDHHLSRARARAHARLRAEEVDAIGFDPSLLTSPRSGSAAES